MNFKNNNSEFVRGVRTHGRIKKFTRISAACRSVAPGVKKNHLDDLKRPSEFFLCRPAAEERGGPWDNFVFGGQKIVF